MSDFRRALVTRDDHGHYLLEWQLASPKHVSIYASDRVNGEYVLLTETAATSVALTLPAAPRQHFLLKTDSSIMPVAERRLQLEGTPNLRDFGGYHTASGAMVPWGRLFRSGRLSALTEADKQFIEALGIARIFDFRREDEVEHAPTALLAGTRASITNLPMGEGSHSEFYRVIRSGELTTADAVALMSNLYASLAREQGDYYGQVLRHLADEDSPLLIHCTAGKDRTGVGAALILLLLGVDRDTVMEDYLLTSQYYPSPRDQSEIMQRLGENPDAHAALLPLMSVRPEFLQGVFDVIDTHYNSLDDYFSRVYGITPAQREAIQARVLG